MKAVAILSASGGRLERRARELCAAIDAVTGVRRREIWVVGGEEPLPPQLPAVDEVVWLRRGPEEHYLPEVTLHTLEGLCREGEPDLLIFAEELESAELCPRLAFRLGGEAVPGCTRISGEPDGAILVEKPVYGGNVYASLRVEGRPLAVTVKKGEYPPLEAAGAYEGPVREVWECHTGDGVQVERVVPGGDNALEEAAVVLVAGQGFGGPGELRRLEGVVERLGVQVGATRPLVLSGSMPLERLVGTTGVSVFPRLLVTAGVSGSGPFMAGAKFARRIIAVNKDPGALVFTHADLGIVADCKDIMRELTLLLEKEAP